MAGTGNAKRWKFWVQAAILVVFVLDGALLVARWRMSVTSSREQLQHRVLLLKLETAQLRANLDRAAEIRARMPEIGRDCDRFYTDDLLGMKNGYPALVGDLGKIASDAGLHASGVRFSQKDVAAHGVTEIEAEAVIEGDYPGLVRFINGLEQSKNFYLLDNLSLASSAPGRIKLNVRLRTYFRS
jgi:Type II secretion system (T2SS), protein M subtype b